jgi:hypothetical protein
MTTRSEPSSKGHATTRHPHPLLGGLHRPNVHLVHYDDLLADLEARCAEWWTP